jgi:ATP-binding cassette subfamily B multidrug efflux pump
MMKSKDRSLLKKTLTQTVSAHKKLTAALVLIIAAAIVTSLLPPLVLERGVNLLGEQKAIPFVLCLMYFLFIVLSDVAESAQNAVITIFGQKMTHAIRSVLSEKLTRLPAEYFHTHKSGDTTSIFTNDGDAIDVLYSDGIVSMIADCFKLIAILIVIYTRSWGLGLLITAAAPLLYLFTRRCQKRMNAAQLDNRRAIAKVSGHVPETLRCFRMIRTFHAEKHMEGTYDGYIKDSYSAVERSNLIDSIYSPVILLVQATITAVMMVLAARGSAFRAAFGLSVGSAVAMISYVGKIFTPLENIGMEIQNIQAAAAAFTHIESFLSEPEWEPAKKENPQKDTICFDHVTFGYEPARPVLRDLSFEILPGENITFAGRTGAGKSTIFRLLIGLYEPDQGKISLGVHSPCAIKPEERRGLYGWVEQTFSPVPGTIRDQITLYEDYSENAIEKALSLSGLNQFLGSLPDGLNTVMDERLFSKGQLQLLSIARAVVGDPKILFLDEITASLDAETETRVLAALRSSARGRTVLSISHRLSQSIGDTRVIEIAPVLEKEDKVL